VRKQQLLGHGSNDVVVPLIPGTVQISFCNAHVQQSGPDGALGNQTLWVSKSYAKNSGFKWIPSARSALRCRMVRLQVCCSHISTHPHLVGVSACLSWGMFSSAGLRNQRRFSVGGAGQLLWGLTMLLHRPNGSHELARTQPTSAHTTARFSATGAHTTNWRAHNCSFRCDTNSVLATSIELLNETRTLLVAAGPTHVQARSQVHAFWSSDPALKVWNHSIALQLPVGYAAGKIPVITPVDQIAR
jgi:hypothetical protein